MAVTAERARVTVPARRPRTARARLGTVVRALVILVVCVLVLFPVYWMILSAFQPEGKTLSDVGIHTMGLALAVALTATSFWVANTSLLWAPGVVLGLAVLAIAQMGVYLVFFLHITTGPDNTNNVLALAFGILIVFLVIAGSLWIMTNLNENLMPSSELMNLRI